MADDDALGVARAGGAHADGGEPALLPARVPGRRVAAWSTAPRAPDHAGWMLAAALRWASADHRRRGHPPVLLGLTFALGIGSAMTSPAWQAITPELVSSQDLPAAIALGGVAFNLARAVGPALGGLATASIGAGMVFLLNAASFLAVLAVLAAWRRTAVQSFEVPEDVFGAMRAGARYVRHSLPLRTVLARSASFVLFASAVWSLLPLVARQLLGLGAVGYGLLLGCLGLGAVGGAAVLPALRRRPSKFA